MELDKFIKQIDGFGKKRVPVDLHALKTCCPSHTSSIFPERTVDMAIYKSYRK